MGWFRVSENDAIREIEKVNAGVKVIRETIRITGDEVVNSNKVEVAVQLQECINHYKLLCLQRLTHRDKSDAALRRLRASGRMANHRGVFHSLQGKSWYDNNWIVYL